MQTLHYSAFPVFALLVTEWMVALWILGAVVGFALPIVTVMAARQRGRREESKDGTFEFRYPPILRLGSLCLAGGILGVVTTTVVISSPRSMSDIAAACLTYFLFATLTGSLIWEFFRFRLIVSPDGISRCSAWRRYCFIQWSDITEISFKNSTKGIEVCTKSGPSICLPTLVGRLGVFLEMCERYLETSRLEPARPAYTLIGRAFPDESNLNL